MTNIIQQVYDFNVKADLLSKGYSDTLESAFQIEEALEGFPNISAVYHLLNTTEEISNKTARDTSRAIVHIASLDSTFQISDVDRLDKACDAIVFAIGSMAKLGLTPSQIEQALNIVTSANLQKLDMPKDDHGKLTKPADFVGPEVELQKILDERK